VEEREEEEEEEGASLVKAPACRHSRLQNLPTRKWGSPQEEEKEEEGEEEEEEEEAHRRKRKRKPNQPSSPAGRFISGGAAAADPASVVNRSQYNSKKNIYRFREGVYNIPF
jgi:hypothetical protein